MITLTNIDSSAYQKFTFTTADNIDVTMAMRYLPTQLLWVADIVDSNGFAVNCISLICSPNVLREFKNIITYGLAIVSISGYDPRDLTSFYDKNATINILSKAEVESIESQIYE